MGKQATVIRLDEVLARDIREFLRAGPSGYSSIDEFTEVALRNQLALELPGEQSESAPSRPGILRRIDVGEPPDLTAAAAASDDTLFVFSNRLGPFKVAARVLANMRVAAKEWPTVDEFGPTAARAARVLGTTLRASDEANSRKGRDRRWIAFPVGKGEAAALSRFITSFAVRPTRDRVEGPMVALQLVGSLDQRRVALTELGWRLACAPSPLLDEAEGHTLSASERDIFCEAVKAMPAEVLAIRAFLRLVREARGDQNSMDKLLAREQPAWTKDLIVAHRTAMLGRLAELGAVCVEGRGRAATVHLTDIAATLTRD